MNLQKYQRCWLLLHTHIHPAGRFTLGFFSGLCISAISDGELPCNKDLRRSVPCCCGADGAVVLDGTELVRCGGGGFDEVLLDPPWLGGGGGGRFDWDPLGTLADPTAGGGGRDCACFGGGGRGAIDCLRDGSGGGAGDVEEMFSLPFSFAGGGGGGFDEIFFSLDLLSLSTSSFCRLGGKFWSATSFSFLEGDLRGILREGGIPEDAKTASPSPSDVA